MQFEDRDNQGQRNERPKEASRNLPMAVLLVLVGIICALLYIGWKYMSDDTSATDDLTAAPADSVANAIKMQPEEEKEAEPTATSTADLPLITVPKVGDKKESTASAEKKPTETKPVEKPKVEKPKETPKVVIPTGGETYTHTVGDGETFFGIANRYNIKKETLKAMNPGVDESGIKVGVTKLKIRIKATHTVGPGDIIRVVSEKYGVSQTLIMQANKKSKNVAQRGEKLIIPYSEKQ